jgi:threonine dehydratase
VTAPSFGDVQAARARVYTHVRPTPLLRYPLLDAWLGCDVWVKHENHHATGAFKIRGGLNLLAQLSEDDRRRGVISASTGNHGQSIAYASRLHGVRCRIVVPVHPNPGKVAAMRALGAEVVEHGRDFDEARELVETMAAGEGWRYVHSANEPHLIAGVGTYALEVFDELRDIDYLFVPVGGGSGAAGCCIVRDGLGLRTRVVGVQAAGADAFARSWRGPARVSAERASTCAEGIMTRTTYDLTFAVLKERLDEVVTLAEEEILDGVGAALRLTHNLAEPAGAASLAAARQLGPRLTGARVVCVMTGANIDLETLRLVLSRVKAEKE